MDSKNRVTREGTEAWNRGYVILPQLRLGNCGASGLSTGYLTSLGVDLEVDFVRPVLPVRPVLSVLPVRPAWFA